MGVRYEWVDAAYVDFEVVKEGYDVIEGDYVDDDEYASETTVDAPLAVILRHDEAYVIQGSASKIRALLRSIDQALEEHIKAEAEAAAAEVEAEQERIRAIGHWVDVHKGEAVKAAHIMQMPDEMVQRIAAEVKRRREIGEISDLLTSTHADRVERQAVNAHDLHQ